MARLIETSRRTILSRSLFSRKTLIPQLNPLIQNPIMNPLFKTRHYIADVQQPNFNSHISSLLLNEIQYESERTPPKQVVKEFDRFTIEDYPGDQWIRLRSKYAGEEEIKIEVTMFDAAFPSRDDTIHGNAEMELHLSFIVNVLKGDDGSILQFVCSAWPDSMEVEKVFFLRCDSMRRHPYMGPDFKDLEEELQDSLLEFLEERGVNDDLAVFLHKYIKNKDRTELIRWMGIVKSFVEK